MGSLPGVVAVGEGEEGGERTIDVWVTGVPDVQLPQDLAPFRVRIRPSGGPIHALGTEEADPDKPTAALNGTPGESRRLATSGR